MNEREYAVVVAMAQRGGSFVKALATAFRCADPTNFARLKVAFPDYWERYVEMANPVRETDVTA